MKNNKIKKRSGTSYAQLKSQVLSLSQINSNLCEDLKCSQAREITLEKELKKVKHNETELKRDLVSERVRREEMVDIKMGELRRLKAPPSLLKAPSQVLDPSSLLGRIASGGYISAGASKTGHSTYSTPPRGGRF